MVAAVIMLAVVAVARAAVGDTAEVGKGMDVGAVVDLDAVGVDSVAVVETVGKGVVDGAAEGAVMKVEDVAVELGAAEVEGSRTVVVASQVMLEVAVVAEVLCVVLEQLLCHRCPAVDTYARLPWSCIAATR